MSILHNKRCLPGSKCDVIVIILRHNGTRIRPVAQATATNSDNYTKWESLKMYQNPVCLPFIEGGIS